MRIIPLASASLYLLLVAGLVRAGRLPCAALLLYLGASALAFLAYLLDKSAARMNRRRTPENTLHLLGLVGGWPGALLAQTLLRHKTVKRPFQIVFWLSVLITCAGLVWLLSPSGFRVLQVLL
jgi:uncharacterized membrane protein YsdA (DUF1294 family)